MNPLRTRSSLFALAFFVSSIASAASVKDYYEQIDPQIRKEILTEMRVRKVLKAQDGKLEDEDDKDNSIHKIDVAQFYQQKCGMPYTRDQQGRIVRPQVECRYTPRPKDNPFSGMSAKFDCAFAEVDKNGQVKADVRKVKYNADHQDGGGYKEVPQAVLGSGLGRLLGFYANTYCAVDLICHDCPSDDPWNENGKSHGAAAVGKKIKFNNVVVEVKQKGSTIIDRDHLNSAKPQGFSFNDEMSRYFPTESSLASGLRIEREALALWVNFIRHGDADPHNNKLVCVNSTKPEDLTVEKPQCQLAAGYVNDYGNSFGYSKDSRPLSLSKFLKSSLKISNGIGIAEGAASSANGYQVSREGRDLFVSMANQITDDQLKDIFDLAQMNVVSDSSVEQWIQGFRRKVQEIQNLSF